MNQALLVAGLVFVGLAALIHVYIFYLESIAWSRPGTWKAFGLRSQADADTVRPMAYNQGYTPGLEQAGIALVLFSAASMVLAATVLVTSSPKLARAAVLQGAAPLLGSALLVLAVVL